MKKQGADCLALFTCCMRAKSFFLDLKLFIISSFTCSKPSSSHSFLFFFSNRDSFITQRFLVLFDIDLICFCDFCFVLLSCFALFLRYFDSLCFDLFLLLFCFLFCFYSFFCIGDSYVQVAHLTPLSCTLFVLKKGNLDVHTL